MVQQVMDVALLDLIMLFTMPTLLGEGIKLFDGVQATLHTVLAQQHVGGVIETHYTKEAPK